MQNKLSEIRNDYGEDGLYEHEVPDEPFELVQTWLNEAIKNEIYEPTALTISTIDLHGKPSSRIVLLKDVQQEKLIFFSNYNSVKGKEIEENPYVAALLFWPELHRQIRIKGEIEKTSKEESDKYFIKRPFLSKLGAWASPQSEIVKDRNFLEQNFKMTEQKFKDKDIPRPTHWGGYAINPLSIEFWHGRSKRLHDRLIYRKVKFGWQIKRLAP